MGAIPIADGPQWRPLCYVEVYMRAETYDGAAKRVLSRSRATRLWFLLLGSLTALGCLEPYEEDEPTDPDPFASLDAPVERLDPTGRPFTTRIVRLHGFSEGAPAAFARADGAVSGLVPPAWRLFQDGAPLGRAIVGVVPGDTGYGPIWRLHRVDVTPAYAGEPIRSRAAVAAAIERGLVTAPVATETILVAPIVIDDVRIDGWPMNGPSAGTVWFRGQEIAWVIIPTTTDLTAEQRQVQPLPAYIPQRVNQDFPLDEALARFDLDGDGRLESTHQVLSAAPRPLCSVQLVRTSSSFRSIDSAGPPEVIDVDDPALVAPGSGSVLSFEGRARLELCPRVDS